MPVARATAWVFFGRWKARAMLVMNLAIAYIAGVFTVVMSRIWMLGKHEHFWPWRDQLFAAVLAQVVHRCSMSQWRQACDLIRPIDHWVGENLLKLQMTEVQGPLGSFQGWWLRLRDTDTVHEHSVVVYLIHGGAFVCGHARMALPALFRLMLQLRRQSIDARIFTLEYPLSHEQQFPVALNCAVDAYRWLAQEVGDTSRIIMMGDSAGGNLVTACLLKLRDQRNSLPNLAIAMQPPLAAILISPWVDLSPQSAVYSKLPKRHATDMGNGSPKASGTKPGSAMPASHNPSSSTSSGGGGNGSGCGRSRSSNGDYSHNHPSTPDHVSKHLDHSSEASGKLRHRQQAQQQQSATTNDTAGPNQHASDPDSSTQGVTLSFPHPELLKGPWQLIRQEHDYLWPGSLQQPALQYVSGDMVLLPHSLVSPIYADSFHGLVQQEILVTAGGLEILLPDIQAFAAKAAATAKVLLHVEPRDVHNFPLLPLLGTKQAAIIDFIARMCSLRCLQ